MSLKVLKAGISDTVQDTGRFGFQHQGINPTGSMDMNAMKVANALVGNELSGAVLELNFPASSFLFQQSALIALSGADFTAKLEGKNIPIHKPVFVPAGSELKFSKVVHGSRCYMAVQGEFDLPAWLDSRSTNTKANAGGFEGRVLKRNDELLLNTESNFADTVMVLPWTVNVSEFYSGETFRCIRGNEFTWLTKKSQQQVCKESFTVSSQSDRMGYHLKGLNLRQTKKRELLSTAVTFGTMQLLPNGDLIVLMADHQTTGGYPRLAHVISADRSRLAQCRPNEKITFQFIGLGEAESLAASQSRSLLQIQSSCKLKLNEFLKERA